MLQQQSTNNFRTYVTTKDLLWLFFRTYAAFFRTYAAY